MTDSTPNSDARWMQVAKAELHIEGGLVDNAKDHGGITNHGVSLRFLVAEGKIDRNHDGLGDFDLDFDGDIDGADIRKLTTDQARDLFKSCIWDRYKLGELPQPFDCAVFDQALNGGAVAAVKMLQRALNSVFRLNLGLEPLTADGDAGAKTRTRLQLVVQQHKQPDLIAAYRSEALRRYQRICAADQSQLTFIKGWTARANGLCNV